jgi:hypothetical protein
VRVKINTTGNIYAAALKLKYNGNVLNATEALEGGFLKQDGSTTYPLISIDHYTGTINYACTRVTTQDGVSGTGDLLVVTFDALQPGASQLELDSFDIVDANTDSIETSAEGGSVNVQ